MRLVVSVTHTIKQRVVVEVPEGSDLNVIETYIGQIVVGTGKGMESNEVETDVAYETGTTDFLPSINLVEEVAWQANAASRGKRNQLAAAWAKQ